MGRPGGFKPDRNQSEWRWKTASEGGSDMESDRNIDIDEAEDVLWHDHYTPEELSDLLGINKHTIELAAHSGELHATLLDHHIINIRREDVVRWLEGRD
jgi:excisionase family DNA binding protein